MTGLNSSKRLLSIALRYGNASEGLNQKKLKNAGATSVGEERTIVDNPQGDWARRVLTSKVSAWRVSKVKRLHWRCREERTAWADEQTFSQTDALESDYCAMLLQIVGYPSAYREICPHDFTRTTTFLTAIHGGGGGLFGGVAI